MTLELTTKFAGITTSPKARGGGVAASEAVGKAIAHIRYIDRRAAVGERAVSGVGTVEPEKLRAAFRRRAQEVAGRGGKLGARVLEKGVVSLPNGWPAEAREEACQRIARHLAPPNSEAMCIVVSHRDRAENSHLHFAAIDGAEAREAAAARAPGAKRIRRKNVIRLSEGGRPKALRAELAGIINGIARERGLDAVEWRSFEARGITQRPGRHKGPRRIAVAEKMSAQVEASLAAQELDEWLSSDLGAQPIDEIFGAPEAAPEPQQVERETVQPPPHSKPRPRRPRAPQKPGTEPTSPPSRDPSRPSQRLRDRIRKWMRKRPPRSR